MNPVLVLQGRKLRQRFRIDDHALVMPLQKDKQVSPMRMKITLLIAGFGPLIAVGLFLQSKDFFG